MALKRKDVGIAIGVGIAMFIVLGLAFFFLASSLSLLITIVIPLILGAALFYASWIFYYRDDNKINGNRRGKIVTSGFLAVAVGTAFFIPTLSLITSYMENPPDVNYISTWSNASMLVNIYYPNPLNIPIKYTIDSLSKDLTVKINHPNSITITSLGLVPPQDSIISTSGNFTDITSKSGMNVSSNITSKSGMNVSSNITSKSGMNVFNMPIYARHFDEISNKTYNYRLIMGYTDSSSKTKDIKQVIIPFKWTIIMKDLPWLNYLWVVMAGVVASRFITFIADTKKDEPIDIDRTESLWIAFTFIIAVIAFASFKENVTLGSILIFNVLASFAFGFGSQKVLELARVFPGTSISTPAQVTGLSATPASNQIELQWNPNPETDIDHYNIYRGQQEGFIIISSSTDS